jgi:hypothetical protein
MRITCSFEKSIIVASLLLLIFFQSIKGFGQFSVKIFDENFSNNVVGWDIRSDSTSRMQITGGKYLLENKLEGSALITTIEALHMQPENYRIRANISKQKGIENNGFGIVWGASDLNNEYEFVISANGYFKILKWENGVKQDIQDWTYQSAIRKWDFAKNELVIESYDKLLKFYINKVYVAAIPYQKPFGTKIGFIANEKMEIEIENLIVENLTENMRSKSVADLTQTKITKTGITGDETELILNQGQKSIVTIEISNKGSVSVQDLKLSINCKENPNAFLYNQLSMINEIKPGESINIQLEIEPDDSKQGQVYKLEMRLTDIHNKLIDSKLINVLVRGGYTNQTYSDSDDNTNYNQYSEEDNCTGGCLGTGLISILTAIILAILQ